MTYTLGTDATGQPSLEAVTEEPQTTVVPGDTEVTLTVTRTYVWTGEASELPAEVRAHLAAEVDNWHGQRYVALESTDIRTQREVEALASTFAVTHGDIDSEDLEVDGSIA